jgi:hypothetical protein
MRSSLIVIFTALLVAGGFGVYWSLQPHTGGASVAVAPVIPGHPTTANTNGGLGPGHRPWFNTYDPHGKLTSQFTAAEFRPQPDGSIQVDRPVMLFYRGRDQYVLLTGDDGVLDATPGQASHGAGTMAMPGGTSTSKNGRLHHVQIRFYSSLQSHTPTITIWTDNIRYDSEQLLMFTDKCTDAAGNPVAADRVPVIARGVDYDFDGAGLTMIFNGRTHRVQLLKIAHGDRLVVKNTPHLSVPDQGRQTAAVPPALASTDRHAVKLVSAAPAVAAPPAMPATAGPTAVQPPPIYHRAQFDDDVRVFQANHLTATARTMMVDFLDAGSDSDEKPAAGSAAPAGAAASPSSAPSPSDEPYIPPDAYSAPPAALEVAVMPKTATQPTPESSPNLKSTDSKSAAPTATTKPAVAKGPMTIRWTGPLQVTELEEPPMMPIAKGQSVVRLKGSPVDLTPIGSEVTAGVATYRTGDGKLLAKSSKDVPEVVLKRANGVTLRTKSIDYDPALNVVTIQGASELDVPQKAGPPMVVTWDRIGMLYTLGTGTEISAIDHVSLDGNVAVHHPKFKLTSKTLRLDLVQAAKSTRPKKPGDDSTAELPKRMQADGDVKARFTKGAGQTQGIDAAHLDIGLEQNADARSVPKTVLANGKVRAFDADQTLTSRHLEATLAEKPPDPSTKPAVASTQPSDDDPGAAVELVSLLATGDVHAVTKAGATTDSQQLRVTTVDGVRQVELNGDTGAVVRDGKGKTLTGSVLHLSQLSPERTTASVDGAGTIHSVATDKTGKPIASATTRPADVSWTDSMSIDTGKNAVEVVGHVVVRMIDRDGGVSIFTGDRAHLDLEEPPDNTEFVEPETSKPPGGSTGPQVKRIVMLGHVTGDYLLQTAGAIAKRAKVLGDELDYTVADGRAVIPGPGKLLIENHKAAGATDPHPSNNRGAMAVAWKTSLVYADAKEEIDIRGKVLAGFAPDSSSEKPADKAAPPMRLETDRLLIKLKKVQPAESATRPARATTRPANDDQANLQVSSILADGAVHFIAHGGDIYCHTADFDPAAQRMIARGSTAEPGHATDLPGKGGGAFDGTFNQLVFDTANEEVVSVTGMGATIRK